jgi:glycosyltransferase involved in cell wall biosynthesis
MGRDTAAKAGSRSIATVISVVMPAHNEEGYLEPAVKTVVTALSAGADRFEVIVVENGSTDATAAEAARLEAAYPAVRAVRLAVADYGAALRRGFTEAAGDVVVNFDVDLVNLDFLERAVATLESARADVVVGSKRTYGSEDRRGLARRAVTATFSLVLRWGFGLHISDTHGLKVLRRSTLLPLVERCRFGQDIFDTELIIRAERAGLRVEELPVRVRDTRPPRTPIARRIPRTLAGLARLWWALQADR